MVKNEEIIQPEEFGIIGKNSLFNGAEYIIPIYQRNYAWESEEIEQMLDDIYDSDTNCKYYLGSLIVNQRSANSFEVVDGQQRLTTLFLLLSFLNDASANSNSLRFEAREKSNKTLFEIYRISNERDELDNEAWLSDEIVNGYSIIRKYFARKTEITKGFESIFKERLEHIAIIRTQVPRNIDLNHYFEVMNTRGEQLEPHEIVKGKILEKVDPEDSKIVAEIWDACAQMNKYVQMAFTKQTRECLFGKNWDSFTHTDFASIRQAINDICNKTTDNNKSSDDEEVGFVLLDKLQKHNKLIKPNLHDDKNNDDATFKSIITFPNFLLQVNEALGYNNEEDEDAGLDDKQFIKIMEHHYQDKEQALAFVFSLLRFRFLFDKYIIKREFAKDYKLEGRWSLQQLKKHDEKPNYSSTYSDDEYDNELTGKVRLLQSCLRITYTSPKTMHWISKVLLEISKDEDSSTVSILEKYCCEKVDASNYSTKEGFGIDRIVFTFLDYLLVRDNPTRFPNYQFQFRTSVEHFYPQNPINGEYWDNGYLNSFGNLALITVSANSKFSNLLPHQKVENYKDNIEQSPKLMLMRDGMLQNNGKWERETAKTHHDQMMKILSDEIQSHP